MSRFQSGRLILKYLEYKSVPNLQESGRDLLPLPEHLQSGHLLLLLPDKDVILPAVHRHQAYKLHRTDKQQSSRLLLVLFHANWIRTPDLSVLLPEKIAYPLWNRPSFVSVLSDKRQAFLLFLCMPRFQTQKTEKEKTASTDVSFSSYPAFRQAYCCTDTIILQKYASVCKGLLQFSEKLSFSYFKPSPIETTRSPQWQSKVQGFFSMKMMPDCCQTSQTALSDMQLLPAKLQ